MHRKKEKSNCNRTLTHLCPVILLHQDVNLLVSATPSSYSKELHSALTNFLWTQVEGKRQVRQCVVCSSSFCFSTLHFVRGRSGGVEGMGMR